jgi:hypothetical protein
LARTTLKQLGPAGRGKQLAEMAPAIRDAVLSRLDDGLRTKWQAEIDAVTSGVWDRTEVKPVEPTPVKPTPLYTAPDIASLAGPPRIGEPGFAMTPIHTVPSTIDWEAAYLSLERETNALRGQIAGMEKLLATQPVQQASPAEPVAGPICDLSPDHVGQSANDFVEAHYAQYGFPAVARFARELLDIVEPPETGAKQPITRPTRH